MATVTEPRLAGAAHPSEAATTVPLIAEHDSWITVDPILGCPADCTYCYLGPLGLRTRRPFIRAGPASLGQALERYLRGRRSIAIDPASDLTPVCLGNYTDMVIAQGNRQRLLDYLTAIIAALPNVRPLVIITKGALDRRLVEAVDQLQWPIYWIFSQSLAHAASVKLEYGPVANLATTLTNARIVQASRYQRSIHFWRPFVPELRPSRTETVTLLGDLVAAGFACSLVIGLKRGKGFPTEDQRLRSALHTSLAHAPREHDLFDSVGWAEVQNLARELRYPVYRNTSCGLSHVSRSFAYQAGPKHGLCQRCVHSVAHRRRSPHREIGQSVATFLQISVQAVALDENARTISVDSVVDEHDYNVLVHGFGDTWDIRPIAVRRQKAWLGVLAERFAQ